MKPDYRIVTNGRLYRVQKNIPERSSSGMEWDMWEDVCDCIRVDERDYFYHQWLPFETRWLWLAKRRMKQEVREDAEAKASNKWSVVIYASALLLLAGCADLYQPAPAGIIPGIANTLPTKP